VLELGGRLLDTWESRQLRRDILLSMALAHCGLAARALDRAAPVRSDQPFWCEIHRLPLRRRRRTRRPGGQRFKRLSRPDLGKGTSLAWLSVACYPARASRVWRPWPGLILLKAPGMFVFPVWVSQRSAKPQTGSGWRAAGGGSGAAVERRAAAAGARAAGQRPPRARGSAARLRAGPAAGASGGCCATKAAVRVDVVLHMQRCPSSQIQQQLIPGIVITVLPDIIHVQHSFQLGEAHAAVRRQAPAPLEEECAGVQRQALAPLRALLLIVLAIQTSNRQPSKQHCVFTHSCRWKKNTRRCGGRRWRRCGR